MGVRGTYATYELGESANPLNRAELTLVFRRAWTPALVNQEGEHRTRCGAPRPGWPEVNGTGGRVAHDWVKLEHRDA